jgi:hypothetical protein
MNVLIFLFSLTTLFLDFVVNQLTEQPWLFSFIPLFFISVPRFTLLRITHVVNVLLLLVWVFPFIHSKYLLAIMAVALLLRECYYLIFWEGSYFIELLISFGCILALHGKLNGPVPWSFFQFCANIGMILMFSRLRFLQPLNIRA